MEYSASNTLTLTFSNSSDYKEIDMFLNILEKCNKEALKSGFRNLFSKEEKLFITTLWEEFKE